MAANSSGPGGSAGAITCPTTTASQNMAIARVWHEEVINRRNPAALQDILSPEVVHHAAGGYPDTTTADEVVADDERLSHTPSPDLHYNFDLLVVRDDLVVERYTASGTQDGPFQDLPATGRKATWTGINIFRIACGRIVEVWSEVDALSRHQQLTGAAARP